ncbi:MAG: class I SAM-dependent methyltransferase [Actinomycetota bacterium]|nr:class I SAM-dependent methyltransferase [Actinomycetota bacterium]
MTFDVTGEAYQRFMGVYSDALSVLFADRAGVLAGGEARVVDVGCGTGALTSVLVDRLGPTRVLGVDPSALFVEAARRRLPEVDIRQCAAEQLPLEDDGVDAALAQLVVSFMANAQAGLAEMARVTRSGGVVGACVWDLAGGRSPLSTFWRAAVDVAPSTRTESAVAGAAEGDLVRLLTGAGLTQVSGGELSVRRRYASFEQWWEPYTLSVGPAGDHVSGLDGPERERLREHCRTLLPERDIEVEAVAWVATGVAP